ncbi:restriction endonuclease [Streptomyces cinereoruber]|uniref:restriction endonuclease n=1 Tax=Streptomyces cinereoruber TaxID=67260 RepID=UPI00363DB2E1
MDQVFCVKEFGVLESSAEQTLGTLRSLGLLTQVGTDTFAATEYATSCLESDEPVDLVRLLHLHVALLGETLDALENSAPSSALALVLAERYPDIPLTHQDVTRRVALFLETGLAERIGLTVRRTELGAALVRTLPLLRPTNSGPAAPVDVGATPGVPGTPAPAAADGDPTHNVGSLAAEVVRAAGDSSDYRRFERAVVAAFRALGVDVETRGGPKKTDAVIELWRSPTKRYRIAVEAKTDGAGLVTDQDIKFRRLGEHRARHMAQGAVLVGPGFDSRLVQETASEKVALLTARGLAALVTCGEADALERIWWAVERRQETLPETTARRGRSLPRSAWSRTTCEPVTLNEEVAGGRFVAVRKAGKLLVRQEARSYEGGPRWARPRTTRLRAGGSGPRAGRR